MRALALTPLLAAATGSAFAQVSTGAIHGTVLDKTGAAIPNATITVTQTATNFTSSVTSSSNGSYTLNSLPTGQYVVKVSKSGFAGYEQTGVVLEVGQTLTIVAGLNVGGVNEEIIVIGGTPAVETTSPVIQDVVNQATIEGLPLNGRNPATLVFTAPGVTDGALNASATVPNSTVKTGNNLPSQIAPVVNGVAPGGTYFSLDGAGNTDPFNVIGGPFPNPDATQEFGVVTGTYGARYVSAPGGAVNVISRSGGNQIHGSVFEFIRNGAVNALRYNTNGAKDLLKRNQYGFAAGGPVIRDKLFVFGSYQQTAIRSQVPLATFVGTPDQQAGRFVQTATGKVVQLTPNIVAATLLKSVPIANQPNGIWTGTTPLKQDSPQVTAKVDYTLGSNRLFARYFTEQYRNASQPLINNNILTAQTGGAQSWNNFAVGDTWANKSGSWVVDGRASYIHVKSSSAPDPSLARFTAPNLGENVTAGSNPTLGTFYAGGFFVSGGSTGKTPRDSWDYNIDVLHVLGKHQIGFGSNLRFVSLDATSDSLQEIAYSFFGTYSRVFYGTLDSNSFADFILGRPIVFAQSDGSTSRVKGKLFGFYAEDKYSATERLTFTAGLRYDPYKPFTQSSNQIDCFVPGQQSKVFVNAPLGLIYPGDPGCNSSGTTGKYGLVQPRIGFAYKLDEQGNTAVRAGFGIYSTQAQLQTLGGFAAPPFTRRFQIVNFSNNDADPYGSNKISNPFANGFQGANYVPPSTVAFPTATGFNASALDSNYRPAYTTQYSLSLQHAFSPSNSMELAYVGTKGTHIAQTYDANLPTFIPGNSTGVAGSCGSLTGTALPTAGSPCSSTTNETARRPYSSEGLLQIPTVRSNATSNYNGLNTTFRHIGKGGISFFAGFNWSKCLDQGSRPASTTLITEPGSNPRDYYGRCDYDQNLAFRSTTVWVTPKLSGSNAYLRTAAGGWTVSGLVTVDAGQPFSVTDSADFSGAGTSLDLANKVPGQPLYKNGSLNFAAFTNNTAGSFGNSGRNSLRTPAYVDFDPAVSKNFSLPRDRVKLLLRFEGFNALNHTNKIVPSHEYNSSAGSFGLFLVARDPRILQAAAKFTF